MVFLTGGSSRADVNSLALLRPVAVIFSGVAIWTLRKEHIIAHRILVVTACLSLLLVCAYLVPLPRFIWVLLPNHPVAIEVAQVAHLGWDFRPAAVVPNGGLNSLFSLFIPICVLLLAAQLTREEKFRLLPVLIALLLASGLLGLLQVIGDAQSPFYTYRITNNGSAVGLLANRNHQAVLLAMLFPMLAVYAAIGRRRANQQTYGVYFAIFAALVLIPLILVTGSRAGLVLGAFAIISAFMLYRKPGSIGWRIWLSGTAVVTLGLLTALLSRAEALQRLVDTEELDGSRAQFWKPLIDLSGSYFPVGYGPGGFAENYAMVEPKRLLDSTYLNRAHNDWLELYASFGLAGLLVAVASLVMLLWFCRWTIAYRKDQTREAMFARLGMLMLAIMAMASVVDYPLRTPIFSALFVIACVWAAGARTTFAAETYNRVENGGKNVPSSLATG